MVTAHNFSAGQLCYRSISLLGLFLSKVPRNTKCISKNIYLIPSNISMKSARSMPYNQKESQINTLDYS